MTARMPSQLQRRIAHHMAWSVCIGLRYLSSPIPVPVVGTRRGHWTAFSVDVHLD